MLISHRFKFIYTKTVKTGGTSVEGYFEPFCMNPGEWSSSHARQEYESSSGVIGLRAAIVPDSCKWWNHMPADLIKQQIGDEVWTSYFKFCVVRNPYEKAVSEFYFRRNAGKLPQGSIEGDPEAFERWLTETGPPIDRDKYLIDGQICMVEFVRYEDFSSQLERVCGVLGVPWNSERLPNFKRGIRPEWATAGNLFTERSKQIVKEAYAFELKYFGYDWPGNQVGNQG